jgi:RNA ligase
MKTLVMTVGPQGSGKTTYCEEKLRGYTRVSQDDHGKVNHKNLFREALERGDPLVVLDRCNHTRMVRGEYIAMARKAGYFVKIVHFNIDRVVCVKRIAARKSHPTLKPENTEQALNWYFREFQMPSKRECDELVVIGQPPYYVNVRDVTAEIGDRRHVIVGDIHGCLDELKQMLDELGFDPKEDVLVCVGDLVDRGPKVRETIEFVRSLPRFHCTTGNHDDKFVRWAEGKNVKIANGLDKSIESFGGKPPPKDVVDYLRSLPCILKTPSGYVVHAGFDPLMVPEEQQKSDCIFMRYYGGKTYFDSDLGVIWHKLWPKDAPRVFFGHIPEVSNHGVPNVVPLDGGCVFGDYLKAWDSRDGIVHYVNARQKYSTSEYHAALKTGSSAGAHVSKREEYVVAGLLRSDKTDDQQLGIYTYTDQCVFARAWDEITSNSRGHVFDMQTGEMAACAFPKFFNLGENEESLFEKFDWGKPYDVYEKADGWLGVLYRHEGKFKVASRGSFHSDGAQWATGFIQKHDLSCLPDQATLLFEILTPRQRIILDYGGQETLLILAAYDRTTGVEYPRGTVEAWAGQIGLPIVKKYDGMDIQECLRIQKDGKHREGFVIRFQDGRRIKVKCDWYMTLAKIMSNMSPIAIWEAMAGGKVRHEFLVQIPEELRSLADQYKETLESQYSNVLAGINEKCAPLIAKHGGDRKSIAMNREHLAGTPAYKAVFAVLERNDKAIEKIVMMAIYPRSNELAAVT